MRFLRPFLTSLALVTAFSVPLSAQEACPCVPLTKLWVATVCETWNCASAALVTANGDRNTYAVPVVGDGEQRWLIVKQVKAGGYQDDSPFQVEPFDGIAGASARFGALTDSYKPMIASSPDGKLLVISLRNPETTPSTQTPRRRTVGTGQ